MIRYFASPLCLARQVQVMRDAKPHKFQHTERGKSLVIH
jgi:hypothetical protein